MYQKNPAIGKGFDWVLIWLYALLVMIGLLCIFSV
jgi:rod shape determining protein RodA